MVGFGAGSRLKVFSVSIALISIACLETIYNGCMVSEIVRFLGVVLSIEAELIP